MATKAKSAYPPKEGKRSPSERRGFWGEQITKAQKRWDTFQSDGDKVIKRFMLEEVAGRNPDTYNILYSSTETIKPSLYAQTPKPQAKVRSTDTQNLIKVNAALLMEQLAAYAIERVDFDGVLKLVVSDYVLPGMGNAWVRYEPQFAPGYDNDNKPVLKEDGTQQEFLTAEGLALDYVHFKDFLCGVGRFWKEVPWVARRVYFTKQKAKARFGSQKANQLQYSYNRQTGQKDDQDVKQAVIWEIWDKETMQAIWYSSDYPDDVLDAKDDPLKLENFFPCPEPIRAVWSTKSYVPKALYSQYKAQAAELDRLTERIRYLTEALKVRGIYDGSQEVLKTLLDGPGNRMIPVENWAAIIANKGLDGSVMWVPIRDVVQCLGELFKQRELCKNEIYEITGFSDIVRGISKASETLGAQQIKADWATGRLKDMQREVQRFCRDIIRLMVEIACEHFSDKTLILYSGVSIPEPSPEEQQAMAQAVAMGQPPPPSPTQELRQMVQQVITMVRSEKLRCANIGVETDSTILPDEQKERQDRMMFLNSMGAFLQQAGPMALQYPDMRGLLGAIMMFTLRTFSASRPLEKEFEAFVQKLQQQPAQPPPGQGDGGAAAKETATIKAETDKLIAQGKGQLEQQTAAQADATKRYEIDQRNQTERQKAQQDHEYRMAQLQLDKDKLNLERNKLGLTILKEEDDAEYQRSVERMAQANEQQDKLIEREDSAVQAEHDREMDLQNLDLADRAQTVAEQPPKEPKE